MSEQSLVVRANDLIQSDQLRSKAKAFLTLKLCQMHALISAEKAGEYWGQLQSLQHHLGEEEKKQIAELQQLIEEEEDPTKGFAGEKIAEIKAKLAEPDINEWTLREFLQEKAEEVRKRLWPGGKQAVWEYLIQVWKTFDRKQALALTSKLSQQRRTMQVRRMNRENPLSVEEWGSFAAENSQNEAVRIIIAIVEDPQPKLTIPSEYVVPVVNKILSQFLNADQISQILDQIKKFISLVCNAGSIPQVFDALKASVRNLANSSVLVNQWPDKFNAAFNLINFGVDLGVINQANAASLIQVLPEHMKDFGLSSIYALISDSENLEGNLSELLMAVTQKEKSEAWFLIIAVERGMGKAAYALACASPRNEALVPRVCCAWLSNYPVAAAERIQPKDIEGDLVAQILYRTDKKERVAFLREITQEGTRPLPGCMWAADPLPEEKKGFWASMFSSDNTFDEIINEYLKRNPLYVSFRKNTPDTEQFGEYLRFKGYGEYNYKRLDPITLESMILWAVEHPEEVKQELNLLWDAIEPEDNFLKVDFLRNAIFERCTTVFAADPDAFTSGFISWLKRKLVDSSLVWQWGKTQYTVRYPPAALASMCLQGAIAAQTISPGHRDKLVEAALTKYQAQDPHAELGAQLYNTGKPPLEIKLPWKTKSNVIDGWQIGVVKKALPAIFEEVFQSSAGQE